MPGELPLRGRQLDEELEGERRLAVLVSRGKAFWMGGTASARPSGGSILGC